MIAETAGPDRMNHVSRYLIDGKFVRPRRVTTPVYVTPSDLRALQRDGRVIWIGSSMRVLVQDRLHPVRLKEERRARDGGR